MSTDKKNINPTNTIPLKLLVDEKKTRVLAAEATSDFVNILLSFLTFPLGTAVRVTNNHPGSIGRMNNLYQSIEQLSTDNFCTEACKSILLRPRNTHALVCKNLKLNIDDTSNGKYFECNNTNVCFGKSHYPNTKCICKYMINTEKSEGSQKHFVKRMTACVITDDLQVLPGNPVSLVQLLCNLGFSDVDQVEELSVDVGLDEVSKLLKHSLVSKTPLTDVFLGKRKLANILIPVYPRNSPSPSSDNRTLPNHAKFPVKLILSKSQNKVMGLLTTEDFIDCLFSFCTVPLGSVVKLLDLNSGLGCIDNLYRTVECLESKWFAMSKNEIMNAGVLKQYKCKNHRLQIPGAKHELDGFPDPRSPTGCLDCFGRFMEAPHLFVVSDNLTVTPLSSPSSISFLKELNVPLNDIEEQEETIGETEALALLKASLTSSSALNNCFKLSGIQKFDESDVAGK